MAFELSTLALKDTSEIVLRHPVTDEELIDDKGEKAVVTVYGTASKEYRNALTSYQNRILGRKGKSVKVEQEIAEAVDFLVSCTASISGVAVHGEIPKSKDDFRNIYSDPAFSWLKKQVDDSIGDVSNFL